MSSASGEVAYFNSVSRFLLVSVGVPMFVLGTVGNFINTLAFLHLPQFKKMSLSVFLTFSFVSSEICITAGLLPQLVYQITGYNPLNKYLALCKLRWFLSPCSSLIALHCICLAMFNQYLITSRQAHRHQWITRRRALYVCLIVLFYSVGSLIPQPIFYTHVINSASVTVCTSSSSSYTAYYSYYSLVIYSIIPILALSVFSLLTWLNIRHNLVRQRGALHQAVTRMLLAQIVMVLSTTVANLGNQMYFLNTSTIPKSALRVAQEAVASTVFTLFGFGTYCMSFYIYGVTSIAFRENIRLLFRSRQRRVEPDIIMRTTTKSKAETVQQRIS